MREEFDTYVRVLCFFVPVGILFTHFTYFLPIVGRPFLSMGLVISVNVLNIILDIVFIRTFGMGFVQAGYVVTTIFCNNYMNLAFGLRGVVVMSLFGQLDSFISIALTGT